MRRQRVSIKQKKGKGSTTVSLLQIPVNLPEPEEQHSGGLDTTGHIRFSAPKTCAQNTE